MRIARLLVVFGVMTAGPPLAAQSLWLVPEGRATLLVEMLRPDFAEGGLGLLSSAWYVTGHVRLSDWLGLRGELPFAYIKFDTPLPDDSDAGVGNPYLGLMFTNWGPGPWLEVGARLPIGAENLSTLVGSVSDIDRYEAWFRDYVALKAMAGYRWKYASGAFLLVRGGPAGWLNTDGGDSELTLHAAMQAGWESARVALAAGLVSFTVLTVDANFGERSLFQAGGMAEGRFGSLRPGLVVFVPVDGDMRDLVNVVLGFRLGVVLP